jgi:DNA-binding response OmpR family regulator
MNNYHIHIFSYKPEICSLIRKTLDKGRYEVSCTRTEEVTQDFITNFDKPIDCLILDKDIDQKLKKTIKQKFLNIPIICLPSLGSELCENNRVTYMSEPFKLSELRKAIEEVSSEINKH